MTENQDFSNFKVVLYYCFLIISLPIGTFFGIKYFLFDGIFGLSATSSNVWSAVFAVIALHVALGLFIFKAYSGTPTKPKQPAKVD